MNGAPFRPAHLVLLTPGFPRDEGDDRCIPALQEYVRALAGAHPGTRLTVIAFHYPFRPGRYQWNGADVVALGGANRALRKPLLWARAFREACEAHRAHGAGLIHSFWLGECAAVGALAAASSGAPHVCTLMGQEARSLSPYAALLRAKRTRLVALSEAQSTDLSRNTGLRAAAVIPWGVDLPAPGGGPRDIDLLGAGALTPLKNYRLFLRTAAALAERAPGLRCVLAGDGPERLRLAAMVHKLGLEKNVTLTGMIPRAELLSLMRRSRVLLHPSLYEGFGYVFAEALASGAQVVSFRVGGARAHPRWHITDDAAEFPSLAGRALNAPDATRPDNPFPLADTVRRYAALYGLENGGAA